MGAEMYFKTHYMNSLPAIQIYMTLKSERKKFASRRGDMTIISCSAKRAYPRFLHATGGLHGRCADRNQVNRRGIARLRQDIEIGALGSTARLFTTFSSWEETYCCTSCMV